MLTIKRRTRRSVCAAALLTALATLSFGPVAGASAATTGSSRIAYMVPEPSYSVPGSGTPTAIFTMRPDGSDRKQLTAPSTVGHYQPNWSPDGSKIAFAALDATSTTGGQFENIFTMNADGSGLTQITHANPYGGQAGEDDWPTWSPDGLRIAYSKGGANIFISNADGSGGETQLTNFQTQATNFEGFAQQPQWSPDGNKMLFFGNPGGAVSTLGIYTIDIDPVTHLGTTLTPLVLFDGNCCPEFANWSPTGSKIAYSSCVTIPGNPDLGCDNQLFIMNADGSGRTQLTHSFVRSSGRSGHSTPPLTPWRSSWSPDERRLAFERTGPAGGVREISILTISTGAITTPVQLGTRSDGMSQPDWSPLLP